MNKLTFWPLISAVLIWPAALISGKGAEVIYAWVAPLLLAIPYCILYIACIELPCQIVLKCSSLENRLSKLIIEVYAMAVMLMWWPWVLIIWPFTSIGDPMDVLPWTDYGIRSRLN